MASRVAADPAAAVTEQSVMTDALIIDLIGWPHMTGMAPPRANDTWKRSDTYAVPSIRRRQLVTLPIDRQLHRLRRRRRHNRMTSPGHQPP